MPQVDTKTLLRRLFSLPYDANTKPAYGLPDIGTSAALRDDIFSSYSSGERLKLRDFFLVSFSVERSIHSVLGEYPRDAKELPRVILLRSSEGEDIGVLGQIFNEATDDDDDETSSIERGSWLKETHEIHIWARTTAWQRDVLYLACRYLLIRGKQWLHDNGCNHLIFRQGRDGEMFVGQMGDWVHQGVLTVELRTACSWVETSSKPTAIQSTAYDPRTGSGEVEAAAWENE